TSAAGLLGHLDRGTLDLDLLRGRCTLPMAAQYAEVQLRRELDEVRSDAVRSAGACRVEGLLVASFEHEGTTYDLSVRAVLGPPAPLTCRAGRQNPVPEHEIVAIATR